MPNFWRNRRFLSSAGKELGCGLLTMLIRLKGGYPEGVMFAILIMNCFAPLIDRSFKSEVFGAVKVKKEAAK